MNKLLVILGPTSTGKTDLGLSLAQRFNGEIVSCDSRQVYKGLDIGTGKLPSGMSNVKFQMSNRYWEIGGIRVWMYDVVDPNRQYTVFDYVQDAGKIVRDIWKRGKLPIIVGGTGLYLKALLEGLPNLAIPVDLTLRKELEQLSLGELQRKIQKISPQTWDKMNNSDRQNPRRLIRAIEISIQAKAHDKVDINTTAVGLMSTEDMKGFKTEILKIGLIAPRQILYRRVDERVVSRIKQGMIDEAKRLHKEGLSLQRMRQLGLEYGVLADFLQGTVKTEDELIKIMQGKIHGFARRQVTWFKKEKNVSWFDISHKNYVDKVENLVAKWYDIRKYATKS